LGIAQAIIAQTKAGGKMSNEEKAMTCCECGGTMKGQIENYRYLQSGLKNVLLKGILVFRCKDCGAEVPEFTGASSLHSLIGIRLLFNDSRLSGDEVRFLRKLVGYSATELAQLAGTSKFVVSRWENQDTFGEHTDRLVRLICLNKMLRDSLPETDQSGLARFMETALKTLEKAKSSKKSVEIDREDLERVTSDCTLH
jgi:transcriptional regulator with XRE-family HTH domain